MLSSFFYRIKLVIFTLSLLSLLFGAKNNELTGKISGIVLDHETRSPLRGVNVIVEGTDNGDATNTDGEFSIDNIPVGSYTLKFSYMGYKNEKRTDIVVRSGGINYQEVEMRQYVIESESIEVTASYFSEIKKEATSTTNLSYEEIRRAPGAGGDISRIIKSLPSVAQIDDQINSLVVRGGSPLENGFYLDNIELPNINHFPTQGTSGGSMGILNVDLIENVNFIAGGYSAKYGNKLSSIMEIDYRQGNHTETKAQVNVDMAGIGGVYEGPINEKCNFILSGRRSYLEMIAGIMDISTIPSYSDLQGKLVYNLNSQNKFTILNILGADNNTIEEKEAEESDWPVYGKDRHLDNTFGINWRKLWNGKGYSNTSLAHTYSYFKRDFKEYETGLPVINNNSKENKIKLRNINFYKINKQNKIEFGFEAKSLLFDYNKAFGAFTDIKGDTTAQLTMDKNIITHKIAGFLSYQWHPNNKFKIQSGLRANYFEYDGNINLSPRLSISYELTDITTLKAAWGQYYQAAPLVLLAQSEQNKDLNSPHAYHYIAGIDHLLNEDIRLTLELYHKDYNNFPIDPNQPLLFLIDEEIYRNMYYAHDVITDQGEAYAQGIEAMIQKKMVENLYGAISFSYFIAQYKNLQGKWHNRSVENRFVFNINGGYNPNNKWEFSIDFIYAGGRPYTSFDIEKSKKLNREVRQKNKVNDKRYPDYHALDIRADRRFNFSSSNLIFYLSIWNAYDHHNVAEYFWNKKKNKKDTEYQWAMTPIFGIEYEF